jgi:hypothetical protein
MLPIPQEPHQLTGVLNADERILWSGRPDPKRCLLLPANLFPSAFGVFWLLSVLNLFPSWVPGIGSSSFFWRPDNWMQQWLFIGGGGCCVLYPVWEYLRATRMHYFITNQRVIIVVNGLSKQVDSYRIHDPAAMKMTERSDHTGDLVVAHVFGRGRNSHTEVPITLVGIPNVRSVKELLRVTFARDAALSPDAFRSK